MTSLAKDETEDFTARQLASITASLSRKDLVDCGQAWQNRYSKQVRISDRGVRVAAVLHGLRKDGMLNASAR